MGRYAKQAKLVCNVPFRHAIDHFLKETVDHYFCPGNKWHSYLNDKHDKFLVSTVSKVLDMSKKRFSKFFFMNTKKE